MKTFIIWSSDKVAGYAGNMDIDPSTYEGMLAVEEAHGGLSSSVDTNDIKDLLSSIYNETDIDLCFYELPQPIRVELYKHCDAGYRQSIEDGAINVLNTAGIFSTKGDDYKQLLHNAWSTADSLGRADDLSYVTFDAYGSFLDCGQLEYKLIK